MKYLFNRGEFHWLWTYDEHIFHTDDKKYKIHPYRRRRDLTKKGLQGNWQCFLDADCIRDRIK